MPFFKNPLFLAVLGGIAVGSAIALNLVLWNDDPIEPRPLPPAEITDNAGATSGSNNEQQAQIQGSELPGTENGDSLHEKVAGILSKDESSAAATTMTATANETSSSQSLSVILPSFDVVRVTPEGNAVIAGQAGPGQMVEILDGDRVIGTVKADDRGEWVFVPSDALLPGNRQLSLRAVDESSGESFDSDQIVMVVVPDRDSTEETFAVASSKQGDQPSTVLQSPGSSSPAILAIDAVDYDDTGEFKLSGRAAPNALVNIYLDNTYIGTAQANESGLWSMIPETRVKAGQYELRADQVDDKGGVQERISMPFVRDDSAPELEPGSYYVVQPGNSLWRIARRVYGEGLSYTVIFKANKEQIGDPDLIFPGQIFTLPE